MPKPTHAPNLLSGALQGVGGRADRPQPRPGACVAATGRWLWLLQIATRLARQAQHAPSLFDAATVSLLLPHPTPQSHTCTRNTHAHHAGGADICPVQGRGGRGSVSRVQGCAASRVREANRQRAAADGGAAGGARAAGGWCGGACVPAQRKRAAAPAALKRPLWALLLLVLQDAARAERERERAASRRVQELQAELAGMRGQQQRLRQRLAERLEEQERAAAAAMREVATLRRAGGCWGGGGCARMHAERDVGCPLPRMFAPRAASTPPHRNLQLMPPTSTWRSWRLTTGARQQHSRRAPARRQRRSGSSGS
jgi:hypothetical protein